MKNSSDVLIIGAGLAGLMCAKRLAERGISCQVLEGSDDIGGRIRTDKVDGFLLDRGFQVFQTAYPVCLKQLDYDALELHSFYPGALVRFEGRFHLVSDPIRRPWEMFRTLFTPIGTLSDKLKVARLRHALTAQRSRSVREQPERSTLDALRAYGFTNAIIERFFRPFLGGVFLDPQLETSERIFEYVMRMFALGDTAIPAAGMSKIPKQLAGYLPAGSIRLGARVASVEASCVTLASGERITGKAIVVATDLAQVAQLFPELPVRHSRGVTCLYYAAKVTPLKGPYLVLNGEPDGPVNNLCVLSEVCPSYAPPEQSLISVSVLGTPPREDALLDKDVRAQLTYWFGAQVSDWRLIRSYRIPHAQPEQKPGFQEAFARTPIRPGIYLCGDYREMATIEGAMVSGLRTGDAVTSSLPCSRS